MPRQPRTVVPSVPIHVTQRGVDRCATFLDDNDFGTYLWALRAAAVRAGCAVHAYVLMTNHVHLLLTPDEVCSPATLMRAMGAWYVRYFNDRYRRTGPLWEGRYRSRVVTTNSYFFACSRYIERNPVRAGLVDVPEAYPWSSFHHNARGETDPILTPHPLYVALGRDSTTRCAAYHDLSQEDVGIRIAAEISTLPLERGRLPVSAYQEAVAARFPRDPASHGLGINAAFGSRTSAVRVFRP
jgi:putative transposase